MFEMFPTVAAVQAADPVVLAGALAGLSVDEIAGLPADLSEVVVAATQRVISAMAARQAVAVDAFAGAVVRRLSDEIEQMRVENADAVVKVDPVMPDPHAVAGSMLAPLLRVAPVTMCRRVGQAMLLVNGLPRTLELAWRGDLEPYRVDRVVAAAQGVGWEHLVEFEARLHDADIADLAGSKVAARAEKAAAKADPETLARARKQAPARRRLVVGPGECPGLSRWDARLPVEVSRRMFAAVDALAQEYLAADRAGGQARARTVDHARADALADLVTSNAQVRTVVEVIVHATSTDAPAPACETPPDGEASRAPETPSHGEASRAPETPSHGEASRVPETAPAPAGETPSDGEASRAPETASAPAGETPSDGEASRAPETASAPAGETPPDGEASRVPETIPDGESAPAPASAGRAGSCPSPADPLWFDPDEVIVWHDLGCGGQSGQGWTDLGEVVFSETIEAMLAGEVTAQTATSSPLEWDQAHRLGALVAIARNPRLSPRTEGTAWFVPGPPFDPRVGILLPEDLQRLLNDPDVQLRISPAQVSSTGRAAWTYRPGAALARAVRRRDHTCRFPGCHVPAGRCDLDHVTPYPHGPTTMDNLQTLCRTHHGFKHHAGWTVTMTPDGTCTWAAPTGRTHTTTPPDPFDQAA